MKVLDGLDNNGQRAVNGATPVNPTDFATKAYADATMGITAATDFNACTATGFYSIANSATNGIGQSQAGGATGILQVYAIDTTHINQVWLGGSNSAQPEIWTRSNNAGTWSRWESVFGRPTALGSFDAAVVNGIYTVVGTATSGPGVTGIGLLTCYGNNVGSTTQVNAVQTFTSFVTGEIWQRQFTASGSYSAWARIFGVPTGGTQGAFLRKNTATNFDVGWGGIEVFNSLLNVAGGAFSTTEAVFSGAQITVPNLAYAHRIRYWLQLLVALSAAGTVDVHVRYNTTGTGVAVTDTLHRSTRATYSSQQTLTATGTLDRPSGTTQLSIWALTSGPTGTTTTDATINQFNVWAVAQ